ncbi:MAG TPA: hypothetical protein VGW38_18090 [Chloroflexota bacterium]|nr:hypothetical protein [Chloroflexota bacterium]
MADVLWLGGGKSSGKGSTVATIEHGQRGNREGISTLPKSKRGDTLMQYTNTDPMTGIEVSAEHEPDSAFTVTVFVPACNGTDDERALRMRTRAAGEVLFALNVLDRADHLSLGYLKSRW